MEIIPLLPNTKKPIFNHWQLEYNKERCRFLLEKNQRMNLGLRLGEIVDVEGDSPHANDLVNQLIGDYEHPSYKSRKSIHHLFINPDPKLTRVVFQDIEFRGFNHQSVIPPSSVDEVGYRWESLNFPIPVMPERLLEFFWKVRHKKRNKYIDVKPGHMKIPCSQCGKNFYLHRKRFEEELLAFKLLSQAWQCKNCRQIDLRPICRQFR